jgi:hypothetical protein
MRTFVLSLGFAIISQTGFCQSNFLITVKGDTLFGDVKMLSYDIVDRVQLTADKKKKSYTALEVKAVYLDNKMYHSVRHDTRYTFMVLKRSGYLSLYGFRIDKQTTYDGLFLVKRDGDAIEVPNLSFKKMMREFLKDCISVSERIKSGELGRKKLDTVILLYNECIDLNSKPASIANPIPVISEAQFQAIQNLKNKIESSSLSSKQDILDLVKDIETKVNGGLPVPNYLMEGLNGYLSDTDYKEDLEKLIEALKNK